MEGVQKWGCRLFVEWAWLRQRRHTGESGRTTGGRIFAPITYRSWENLIFRVISFYMRKTLFLSLALSLAGAISLHAQSIKGTNWKLYIDELHDTLTLHIKGDSSFVTDGSGEVVVRSLCKISKDTISLKDIDGKYVCPDQHPSNYCKRL